MVVFFLVCGCLYGFYTILIDEENGPKTVNDLKLINAGKILENDKTLAGSRSPVSEVPGGIITMLAVVRPPMPDKNNEVARWLPETEQLSMHDSVTEPED
ncbi:hypothetical protein L6452_34650 [Arctium lappa]|uniref:Uncharacterized protein n=1 Tax=Arctium lappa TaxID=4217 RepID=A0ACB8YJ18_ARCLA|nr:hypothetical protein L6452_34650 [Arctium lappa]